MCDTLAIVGSDGVMFAKNSDRDANEPQLLEWHPRRSHSAGATLRCTWIEIPQVRETHAVLLSRPRWMWGAEMGTNEHGVTIGNEAVFTREPYAKVGLLGMDLLRLALERADSAKSALEVIFVLLAAHGQGGSCSAEHPGFTYHNSFIVADLRQAFVLETAGKHTAVEEIYGARSISNGLTIPSFVSRYGDPVRSRVAACRARQKRTASLAGTATGLADLMRILRDHGTGNSLPNYSWLNGGLAAPCVHAAGLVAGSQTTASWVAHLRPEKHEHWITATAAPCTSLFKPVSVDEPVELGPCPAERADQSLWWSHERLHRAVMRDPARLLPLFTPERDTIEADWLAAPPDSQAAFDQHSRLGIRWLERVLAKKTPDVRPWYVRRFWQKANERAGLELPSAVPRLVSAREN
jgi:dipeptidase